MPHLLNALVLGGSAIPWRGVLVAASMIALVGAAFAALFVRAGPLLPPSAPFDARHMLRLWKDPASRYANLGYLGHMWELYAMWTWLPLVLLESYRHAGMGEASGRLAGFSVVAAGSVGCVLAGALADRFGRTLVAGASLVISGSCCLVAGAVIDAPLGLTALGVVWGAAVVADSAQFSAALSEVGSPAYVGTELTVQVASGFLLTLVSIFALPRIAEVTGWGPAFAVLALGPVVGVYGMARLRARPEATRMAGGRR
jgi:hypothetical protein